MNTYTRNNNGISHRYPFDSAQGKPLPITHYLLPIPHYLLLILLFFSTLAFGQAGQMKVAGNVMADTIKANTLIKNTGSAGEILLANGLVVTQSSTPGLVLTSNANGTPTWQTASAAASGTGPSFTQAANAGSAGTQNGLGLGTSTPNSLFTIDGTGYAKNKIFNISSDNSVSGVLNSVDNANVGLNFAINNEPQWFVGIQPVNNTPDHLIFKSKDYTNNTTPTALKMGINRNDPYFNLDIEGSFKAKGYRYNIRKISPASGVPTDINLDWSDDYILIYPSGSNLSNIRVHFNTLPEYNEWFDTYDPFDFNSTIFDTRKLNFTSKRIVVKVIGNETVTNNNFLKLDFASNSQSTLYDNGINRLNSPRVINATYNQTYVFLFMRKQHSSIFWSLENRESL